MAASAAAIASCAAARADKACAPVKGEDGRLVIKPGQRTFTDEEDQGILAHLVAVLSLLLFVAWPMLLLVRGGLGRCSSQVSVSPPCGHSSCGLLIRTGDSRHRLLFAVHGCVDVRDLAVLECVLAGEATLAVVFGSVGVQDVAPVLRLLLHLQSRAAEDGATQHHLRVPTRRVPAGTPCCWHVCGHAVPQHEGVRRDGQQLVACAGLPPRDELVRRPPCNEEELQAAARAVRVAPCVCLAWLRCADAWCAPVGAVPASPAVLQRCTWKTSTKSASSCSAGRVSSAWR